MELPKEIQNIIFSMVYKDSNQKTPLAMLIKNLNEDEYPITLKNVNGNTRYIPNHFALLRHEILRNHHYKDFEINLHCNWYDSVIRPSIRQRILVDDKITKILCR